jgi:hypothetical protein
MSTLPENEKVALENHGNASAAPSLVSDESLTNPTGINEKAGSETPSSVDAALFALISGSKQQHVLPASLNNNH